MDGDIVSKTRYNRRGSKQQLLFADDEDDDNFEKNVLTRRRTKIADLGKDDHDQENFDLETTVVMEFQRNIDHNTLHWIIDKIRSKKVDGGAGLLLRREPHDPNSNRGLIIHISASRGRYLELADELGIVKQTKSGKMWHISLAGLDDFFLDKFTTVEDILTPADRQIIIKHALDSIKATDDEKYLPGMLSVSFFEGESIIYACIHADIIKSMYSLHDTMSLKKLGKSWYKTWKKQPIEDIRAYFGESIGVYFAFVEFYTYALVVPAVAGFLQYFLSIGTVPFFCFLNVVWMAIFSELWRRKCSGLAYKWGTISMTSLDRPRPGYYGKLERDPITGKIAPQYPIWKTYTHMYCISLPTIIICMGLAVYLTLLTFWFEDTLKEEVEFDSYWLYLPSIIQSIIVALLSSQFEKLANFLTTLENHRTQSQYERHRVVKLIVLEFINNFFPLFYIAFILRDVAYLKSQLTTQLIIFQVVQSLQETLLPIAKQKLQEISESVFGNNSKSEEQHNHLNIFELDTDDPRIAQNKRESCLDEYESTYEDYLELYIQFGYVALFSSVAPLAAFWALVNNLIEIRLDGFKLCTLFKRPFAKRAKNTGAWLLAFEVLGVMSVITNCGILYILPEIRNMLSTYSSEQYLLLFVIVEHGLLFIFWALHMGIHDRPYWVRVALAKTDYESRQALKREV